MSKQYTVRDLINIFQHMPQDAIVTIPSAGSSPKGDNAIEEWTIREVYDHGKDSEWYEGRYSTFLPKGINNPEKLTVVHLS